MRGWTLPLHLHSTANRVQRSTAVSKLLVGRGVDVCKEVAMAFGVQQRTESSPHCGVLLDIFFNGDIELVDAFRTIRHNSNKEGCRSFESGPFVDKSG